MTTKNVKGKDTAGYLFLRRDEYNSRKPKSPQLLLKMTDEMTADYIMIIWLVEMTVEMTAEDWGTTSM